MNVPTLPASSKAIELYIARGYEKGLKGGTVRSGVAAIAFYHKRHGLTDPTRTYRIARMLKGVGNCSKISRKLLPIGFNLLIKLVDHTSSVVGKLEKACLKAVFLLQYYGCLRIGELVKSGKAKHMITMENLKFFFDGNALTGVKITLATFKHSDKEAEFKIRATGTAYCPVAALLDFCELRGLAPGRVFLQKNRSEFARDFIAKHLKVFVGRLGLDVGLHNTHSFRIGRASDMAAQGVPDHIIKKTGRWKSSAYTRYIRFDDFTVPDPAV